MISSGRDWKGLKDIDLLSQLAIDAALSSDWTEAEKINKKIISLASGNVEALNRLARAQTCAGDVDKAQKTYKKVLELDPYNIIAKKNVEKLSKVITGGSARLAREAGKTNGHSNGHANVHANVPNLSTVFLYEPGKTKVINLLNLASPSVLGMLSCGDRVEILPKKHSVSITDLDGNYLGALPDDVSHKILFYLSGGNKYEAYIKFSSPKSLSVFIRETERSNKFTNQPSFQDAKQYFEEEKIAVA